MALAGMATIGGAWGLDNVALLGGPQRLDSRFFVAMGVLGPLATLGLMLRDHRWVLPGLILVSTAASLVWIGRRPPARGDRVMQPAGEFSRVYSSAVDWMEPGSRTDAWLGVLGRQGGSYRQHHRDFDVTYTHDAAGFRATPPPKIQPPRGLIAFVGCSYTYGVGVADSEVFTSILAREAWPDYRVRNVAYSAWGTRQALQAVKSLLAESPPPDAIVYCMIVDHLKRNFHRASWYSRVLLEYPDFQIVDGRPVFVGIHTLDGPKQPDSPALARTEESFTRVLICEMQRLCVEAGVDFAVALLDDEEHNRRRRVTAGLGCPTFDYANVSQQYYPIDAHPNPTWHRWMAQAFSSDAGLARALGMPDLYRPKSVSLPEGEPSPAFLRSHDSRAELQYTVLGDTPRGWRFERIPVSETGSYLRIVSRYHTFEPGRRYEVRFEAASNAPVELIVEVQETNDRWKPLADSRAITVQPGPAGYRVELTPKVGSRRATMSIVVPSIEQPLEIRDVRSYCDSEPWRPLAWTPGPPE